MHTTISTTELVRNLSSIIDKIRISGQSLFITKGTQTVAELSPPPESGYPISHLSNFLSSLPTLHDDASSMAEDLQTLKQKAELPESLWD